MQLRCVCTFALNTSYRPSNSEIGGMVPALCNSASTPRFDHLASAQESIVRQDGLVCVLTHHRYTPYWFRGRYRVTRVFVSQLHCAFAGGCIVRRRYIGHRTSFIRFPGETSPCAFFAIPRRFPATFLDVQSGHFPRVWPRHVRELREVTWTNLKSPSFPGENVNVAIGNATAMHGLLSVGLLLLNTRGFNNGRS